MSDILSASRLPEWRGPRYLDRNETTTARLGWPAILLSVLLIGHLTMSRSFAHLGIAPLFITEISLAALLVFRPQSMVKPWLDCLINDGPLTPLAYAAVVFVLYGTLQLARGLGSPNMMGAIQNYAFNVYIIFLFAGVWLGQNYPDLCRQLIRALGWIVGIYGILYLVVLAPAESEVEDIAVLEVFGQPGACAVVILGMLAFEPDLRRVAIPILLNGFVMLGMQMRAEWLGFSCAILAFSSMRKQFNRLMIVCCLLIGLLLIGLITDFKISAPAGRGGDFSARAIIARAVAAVDQRTATYISPRAVSYASTVSWRTGWWKNIYRDVHETETSSVIGYGYAYPIWNMHPERITQVKTPHNIAMFCLAYGGWVGVVIFYSLQALLGWNLWKVFRLSGNPFGFCLWILICVWSVFDNLLEAAYGAVPFYLLCGMQLALLLPLRSADQDAQVPAPALSTNGVSR